MVISCISSSEKEGIDGGKEEWLVLYYLLYSFVAMKKRDVWCFCHFVNDFHFVCPDQINIKDAYVIITCLHCCRDVAL